MARDATIEATTEATTTAADRPGDDADVAAEVVGACCSVLDAPLAEAAAAELAKGFAALADPVRLRLLSMIAATEEVCSCDLLEPLGKAQPTVSHHTKALAEAGLIIGEKRGRWVWWRVVPERVEALRDALT
jgi:ArsR family transcriptional regulator, arsenate/arsenite/antimonite-responsive transcriptional repressor